MVFSSLLFLFIFLPLFLMIYYVAPKRLRNFILFIASLIFYAWGEPVYVLIMIFSTLLDYTVGRVIDHYRTDKFIPKIALAVSVCGNLGMLGFFKYADFFIENLLCAFYRLFILYIAKNRKKNMRFGFEVIEVTPHGTFFCRFEIRKIQNRNAVFFQCVFHL